MKRIRVLKLIVGFALEGPLGGIERFGVELVQALDGAQIEPILCGMWSFGTPTEQVWIERLAGQGIEAFMGPPKDSGSPLRNFWQMYRAVAAQLRGRQVDLIHSHSEWGDMLALLLARQVGARGLVRTVHNEREWGKRPFRRLLLTNLLYPLTFDQELGVSQQVVANLNGRLLVRRQAVVGYNALNFGRFERPLVSADALMAAKKAELGIPPDAVVVGSVGRLTEQKGYHRFVEAAAQVAQQRSDVYFLLVGGGHLAEVLRGQAVAAGLGDRFVFTGPRTDVDDLLPLLSVFVNSSLWEGLPTVILESMAARVPVVATAVSGTTELVIDGQTGLLVPPDDAEALAAAIVRLLALSEAEVAGLKTAAFDHIRATFAIESIARQHEGLYRGLLGEKRG